MAAALSTLEARAYLPVAPRDYLILFALDGGSLHGLGILKAIESGSGGVPVDPANLYRSLRKLERDGLLLETPARATDAGGPPRRFYRLTSFGRSVLVAEADRLSNLTDAARKRKLVTTPQAAR